MVKFAQQMVIVQVETVNVLMHFVQQLYVVPLNVLACIIQMGIVFVMVLLIRA
jgi:hypothetical protein